MRVEHAQLWVHDQDEALAFYTEKLGMEVYEDVTMAELGNFRWLTVRTPGADHGIVLMAIPGAPMLDDDTKEQIHVLMGKGFAGTVFFTTDDVYRDFEDLKARGLEFVDEPFEQPYGIDCSFRDPSGNNFRLTQVTADLTAG
jgi:catechol 2,3-dioxygenase-like lactoylglutathione lyase family enzyme